MTPSTSRDQRGVPGEHGDQRAAAHRTEHGGQPADRATGQRPATGPGPHSGPVGRPGPRPAGQPAAPGQPGPDTARPGDPYPAGPGATAARPGGAPGGALRSGGPRAGAARPGSAEQEDTALPPVRPPLSAESVREIAHLLSNFPMDLAGFLYVSLWLWLGIALSVTVIGLPLLVVGLLGSRLFGRAERARARVLLGVRVEEPSPLRTTGGDGFFGWLWTGLKDPVGWRHALYSLVRLPWGILSFVVTVLTLFVGWPALPWVARGLTQVDRALVRGLLSPSDELERRIAKLEEDRGTVANTATADLRRIERDLHDGAQARLVSLAMELGLAKEKLLEDPEAAAKMVDEAHGEVKLALQELRDLARGIHPAILTDRGLGPALSALAARCTVPVTVTTNLPTRAAPAIEGIAYFTTSELLQNISKHSHATQAHVDLWRTDHRLLIHVQDNGHGGATATTGSGLAGLAERLHSVDGLLLIDSPTGGPTAITAELPWRDPTDIPGAHHVRRPTSAGADASGKDRRSGKHPAREGGPGHGGAP